MKRVKVRVKVDEPYDLPFKELEQRDWRWLQEAAMGPSRLRTGQVARVRELLRFIGIDVVGVQSAARLLLNMRELWLRSLPIHVGTLVQAGDGDTETVRVSIDEALRAARRWAVDVPGRDDYEMLLAYVDVVHGWFEYGDSRACWYEPVEAHIRAQFPMNRAPRNVRIPDRQPQVWRTNRGE